MPPQSHSKRFPHMWFWFVKKEYIENLKASPVFYILLKNQVT